MLSLIQLIFPWLDSPRADALDVLKSSVLPSLKLEPDPPDDELEAADKEDDPEVDIEEVPELPIVLLKRSVPDLIDRRKVPRKERSERGRGRGQRSLEGMNAFMVHQTAVLMSVEQADGVPAPCVIYPDGTVVLNHDMEVKVWHGDAANTEAYGVELVGRFAGVFGNEDTIWVSKKEKNKIKSGEIKSPLELVGRPTPEQLSSLTEVARYVTTERSRRLTSRGIVHNKVIDGVGHRQSKKTKNSDPGDEAYKHLFEIENTMPDWFRVAWSRTWSKGKNDKKHGVPAPDAWTGLPNGIPYSWKVDLSLKESSDEARS